MNIQVINKSKHSLPAYATELSAGMDIRANLSEPITLEPLQRCLVPTGLYIALPQTVLLDLPSVLLIGPLLLIYCSPTGI